MDRHLTDCRFEMDRDIKKKKPQISTWKKKSNFISQKIPVEISKVE